MSHVIQWFRRKRTYLPPAVPDAPVVTNVTANGATLSWVAVPGATIYKLEQSIDNVAWATTTTTAAFTYDASGLTQSSLYYFRLSTGSTRGGYSAPSEVSIVTLDTPTPPVTPTAAPSEISHGITTVSVGWTAVATATAYELWRSTNPTTGFAKVFDGNALLFTDSTLTAGTGYYYKYLAKNADGSSGFSPTVLITTDATPPAPPTPAQPTAGTPTSSSVQITWVNSGGATDSELQRRQTAPTTTTFVTVYSGQGFTFLQTGLAASATYEFKVRESNSAGTSAYSPVRVVTTGSVSGTNVQPVSALSIRERTGVAGHPNFGTATVYNVNWVDDQIRMIAEAGYMILRGPLGGANADNYAAALRKYGLKWEMPMCEEGDPDPTSQTLAETRANVRKTRENYADICFSVDGINEPDATRSGSPVPANWAQQTFDHQKAIWQEAKWNLTSVNGPIGSSPTAGSVPNPLRNCLVLGPAMHDIKTEQSYTSSNPSGGPRHWGQLSDLGILNYQDAANVHSYNGGGAPEKSKMDLRIQYMESDYGAGYPRFVSEWGYHNGINCPTNVHNPISEAGAAVYVPRGYLQNLASMTPGGTDRALLGQVNYEVFDDLDPERNEHEKNFGVIGYAPQSGPNNPTTWRLKPESQEMKAMKAKLLDPAGTNAYTPNRVFLDVSSTVSGAAIHWVCTATKAQSNAGTATVWVWRELDVWNVSARTAINVPTVATQVEDRVGTRTFQVGPGPLGVDLR